MRKRKHKQSLTSTDIITIFKHILFETFQQTEPDLDNALMAWCNMVMAYELQI